MTTVPINNNAPLTFLVRWLRAPRYVGAVTPSSRYLARAMARQIPRSAFTDRAPVVELGGGTGSITQGLLEAGVAPDRLYVVERDPGMAELLRRRFPLVNVLCGDAEALPELLKPFGIDRAAAVVSGLPLLLFSHETLTKLMASAFSLLGPDGPLIQFTYGAKSPVPPRIRGLAAKRTAMVLRNFPPAFVWTYRRTTRQDERTAA
ncbi:MAG TPA: methyltransferase domain-containing protein [Aliidongia sp.]|nr:methyltransferase domain-containing protein [Aliidongia sp.]